jgi:hypothetical protein
MLPVATSFLTFAISWGGFFLVGGHSFCTRLSTVQAVGSDGVGDIDTHWPTASCCSLGVDFAQAGTCEVVQ